MIDEKKLLEKVNEKMFEIELVSGKHSAFMKVVTVNNVKKIIAEQPKVGEWIPVSERLPEESGEYWVWYDCGEDAEEGCTVVNFDAEYGAFGYWHDEYDNFTLGFLDSDFLEFKTAIAWMPLPEPYKGE